jgi:hypothetical protein
MHNYKNEGNTSRTFTKQKEEKKTRTIYIADNKRGNNDQERVISCEKQKEIRAEREREERRQFYCGSRQQRRTANGESNGENIQILLPPASPGLSLQQDLLSAGLSRYRNFAEIYRQQDFFCFLILFFIYFHGNESRTDCFQSDYFIFNCKY